MATEPKGRDQPRYTGPRPGVYVVLFYCLGFCAALAAQTMVRIKPAGARWWLPVLGAEIAAYVLTLFVPPVGRFHLGRALLRVVSGMGLRFLIAFTCGLFLLIGGEPRGLWGATMLFWGGHWPAAAASIAVVAAAVYVLRVVAVRRAQISAAPPSEAPARRMTRDELLQELMSGEPSAEATQPLPTSPTATEAVLVEPPPSIPLLQELEPTAIAELIGPLQEPEAGVPPAVAPPWQPLAPIGFEPVEPREAIEQAATVAEAAGPPGLVEAPSPAAAAAEVAPLSVPEPEEPAVAPPLESPAVALAPPEPAVTLPEAEPLAGAAEAQPVETAPVAGVDELVGGTIRLPAETILRSLPPALLAVPVEEAVTRMPGGVFCFPWDEIAPQLAQGEVRIPACDLMQQFPPAVLAGTPGQFVASLPKNGVALPLAEIVSQVPAQFFALPPDQTSAEVSPDEPAVFQEASRAGVAPATAQWAPPVPPPPPPPPEPQPVVEVAAPPPTTAAEEVAAVAEESLAEPAPAPVTPALPWWLQPRPEGEPLAVEAPPAGPAGPALSLEAASVVGPPEAPLLEPDIAATPAEEPLPEPEPVSVEAPAPDEAAPAPVAEVAAAQIEQPAAPAAEPVMVGLSADLAAALLRELRSLDCRNVDTASQPGLTIAVAHTSPASRPELADRFAELVVCSRELARQGEAGEMGTTLVIGAQGAAFVGAANRAASLYLGVETDRAGAGQAAVAARKALPLLAEAPGGGRPTAPEGESAVERLIPDPALGDLASRAISVGKTAAFQSRNGLGLLLVGVTLEESADLAAAALAAWKAARQVHSSGVDKVIVLGSDRTIGLALAEKASAVVVAGFAPGVNTGLVGTEVRKLAQACDQAMATGGIAGYAV